MIYFLKVTALNLPRLTRLAGMLLVLAVGAIHLYLAPRHFEMAAYVGVGLVVAAAASLVAVMGILRGAPNWGWLLGAWICGVAFVAYLVTRAVGLEGFEEAKGDWANPWGSLSMMIEGLYLGLYFMVMTGAAVAAPDERHWRD